MNPKVTVYLSANAGTLQNGAKDNISLAIGGIGVKVESDKYEIFAEGGYGNAVYAKAEGGVKIPFQDSNFGLKASLGGQYVQSTRTRDYYKNIFEEGANSPEWKSNDLRGYGNVALTYNSPSFKASVGVQGGIKTCTQPSLEGITLAQVGETKGTDYQGRTTKSFVTPTVSLEVGKNFKGTLDASLDHVAIGAKLNIFKN